MADIVVKTEDVVKEYRMGSNILRALDGINIEIERGEYISLMGPSGSGKSTLFNMIGALDRPTEGQVYIDGQNMVATVAKTDCGVPMPPCRLYFSEL